MLLAAALMPLRAADLMQISVCNSHLSLPLQLWRLHFQADPSAWHPITDSVFPAGWPHQPLIVSQGSSCPGTWWSLTHSPTYLFIYWRCSPEDPSEWISYMLYSQHCKTDHQKHASSLIENPRVFVNPVNILSCVYTCVNAYIQFQLFIIDDSKGVVLWIFAPNKSFQSPNHFSLMLGIFVTAVPNMNCKMFS